MQINIDILVTWGALTKKIKKDEQLFLEGEEPKFYYQIISGSIKLFNMNAEGKEFTQGVFSDGESFGEPPLFIDENYPSNAVTLKDSIILRLPKDRLFQILEEYPSIQFSFIKLLSQRIYNKSTTSKEIISNSSEIRIIGFLNSFKKRNGFEKTEVLIPFTRQEIANYTGLRVETVIRTLCKMKENKKVKIIKRKLYF